MRKLTLVISSSQIRPLKETGEHSYHRRAFRHNYHAPFIYHIILKKAKECEAFGMIEGDARIPFGNPGCASIRETAIGCIIAKSILHLPYEFPIIKLFQFVVMPDHVHILLQVLNWSTEHLDFYIDSLKNIIASKVSMGVNKVFADGYCDKPLYENCSLDNLFRYIRENPHRLAMRHQYPQFFQRIRNLRIGEMEYEAYGNLFLFRNPDKQVIKISRKDSPEVISEKTDIWLKEAVKGSILVSPFISPKEKDIRKRAEKLGAKIILITHEAFSERFKPPEHDFKLCSHGNLLIISIGKPPKTRLSREICIEMNSLAHKIVNCQ